MSADSNATSPPGLTLTDLNTDIDSEPRIRDLMLAKRLGFTNPVTIRKLVERNRTELKAHGVISTVEITSSSKGGRPGREYWLNEGQALVLCALSRTEQAAAVRHAMITICMQWRRTQAGQPPLPPPPALPPPVPAEGSWEEHKILTTAMIEPPPTSWPTPVARMTRTTASAPSPPKWQPSANS